MDIKQARWTLENKKKKKRILLNFSTFQWLLYPAIPAAHLNRLRKIITFFYFRQYAIRIAFGTKFVLFSMTFENLDLVNMYNSLLGFIIFFCSHFQCLYVFDFFYGKLFGIFNRSFLFRQPLARHFFFIFFFFVPRFFEPQLSMLIGILL